MVNYSDKHQVESPNLNDIRWEWELIDLDPWEWEQSEHVKKLYNYDSKADLMGDWEWRQDIAVIGESREGLLRTTQDREKNVWIFD